MYVLIRTHLDTLIYKAHAQVKDHQTCVKQPASLWPRHTESLFIHSSFSSRKVRFCMHGCNACPKLFVRTRSVIEDSSCWDRVSLIVFVYSKWNGSLTCTSDRVCRLVEDSKFTLQARFDEGSSGVSSWRVSCNYTYMCIRVCPQKWWRRT